MRESILDSELAHTTIAPAGAAGMGRWVRGKLGLFLLLWLGAIAWPLSTLISFDTTPGTERIRPRRVATRHEAPHRPAFFPAYAPALPPCALRLLTREHP
jgi:hypothetical protein